MKKYTLGFIFTTDLKEVLLIHKLSPEWQKGKVNGIGGKVEEGERNIDGIIREVQEETALEIDADNWTSVGTITEPGGSISVFAAIYSGKKSDAKSNDKEEVVWYPVSELPESVISNLRWLIPLALDKLQNNLYESFSINYKKV